MLLGGGYEIKRVISDTNSTYNVVIGPVGASYGIRISNRYNNGGSAEFAIVLGDGTTEVEPVISSSSYGIIGNANGMHVQVQNVADALFVAEFRNYGKNYAAAVMFGEFSDQDGKRGFAAHTTTMSSSSHPAWLQDCFSVRSATTRNTNLTIARDGAAYRSVVTASFPWYMPLAPAGRVSLIPCASCIVGGEEHISNATWGGCRLYVAASETGLIAASEGAAFRIGGQTVQSVGGGIVVPIAAA